MKKTPVLNTPKIRLDRNSPLSNAKTAEVRLKELRSRAAKASGEKYSKLQQEIEIFEQQIPTVPICPQLWTSDITPEQLGTLMAENDEAMSVLSDEAGVLRS